MNLARAFIARKRLTNYVNKLASDFDVAEVVEETTPVQTMRKNPKRPSANLDADAIFSELRFATDMLAKFNALIDEANAKSPAREILSKLTGLKRVCNLLDKKITQVAVFEPEVVDYDSYAYCAETNSRGNYVTRTFKLKTMINYEDEKKAIQKEIQSLEDKLAEINSTIVISIPEDLETFLNNI